MSKAAKVVALSDASLSVLAQVGAGADLSPGRGASSLVWQDLRRRVFIEQTLRLPELGVSGGHRWQASVAGRAELAREARRVRGLSL